METGGKRLKNITIEEIVSTIKTLEALGNNQDTVKVLKRELMPMITEDTMELVFSVIDPNAFLFENNVTLMRIILKYADINVNVRDKNKGETPLMMTKDEEIARMLLSHPSIDVNAKDSENWTALMIAVVYYRSRNSGKIIQMLLSHPKINVNDSLPDGRTALYIVARYSNEDSSGEVVKMLLEHPSIDVNAKTRWNNTPLTSALQNINKDSNAQTVHLLLSHPSIDVNVKNNDKKTALFIAAEKGHISTMIAIGRRPDTQDLLGAIPHCATDKCKVMLYAMIRSQRIGELPKHICKLINMRLLLNDNTTDLLVLSKMMGLPGATRMYLSDILSTGHYYYNETNFQIQRAHRLCMIRTTILPMLSSLSDGLFDITGIDPTGKTLEEIKKLLQ